MKTLRYAFWGLVALCLVLIGLANTQIITLRALPPLVADTLGFSPDIEVPLFMAIFIGVGVGLLIGFLWEWLREHKVRSTARATGREAAALRRELDRLKDADGDGKDDVLQLLERS